MYVTLLIATGVWIQQGLMIESETLYANKMYRWNRKKNTFDRTKLFSKHTPFFGILAKVLLANFLCQSSAFWVTQHCHKEKSFLLRDDCFLLKCFFFSHFFFLCVCVSGNIWRNFRALKLRVRVVVHLLEGSPAHLTSS